MNLLLVSFYYTPELGAAPTRIATMAEGLHKLGANVDVLTCLPNYPKGKIFEEYRGCFSKKEVIENIKVFRYWTYATVDKNPIKRGLSMISFAVLMWTFGFRIKQIKKYDRIIVQCPPLPVAVSALTLFKKIFGKRVYINISDLWPLSAVELGAMKPEGKMFKIFSWMERFVYKNADGIFGQSQEILDHISKFESPSEKFLYRNVKNLSVASHPKQKSEPLKIVYAGLFGVAQNILGIIENVNFKNENVEFHLYGGGNQMEEIKQFIANHPDCNIFYHGYVNPSLLNQELEKYDVSIVPLAVPIRGAVPSKIFDLIPLGLPILFCGGGEGAQIIESYKLGLTSSPGDYDALIENIRTLNKLSIEDYTRLSMNCIKCADVEFNLSLQLQKTYQFLSE